MINTPTDDATAGDLTTTERIVEAVADATGADPLELPPLYDAIDPEALATVCETATDADLSVEFAYADCVVTVSGSGDVEVTVVGVDAAAVADTAALAR